MATYCVKALEWSKTGRWGYRDTTYVVVDKIDDFDEAVSLAKSAVIDYVEGQWHPELMTYFDRNDHHFGAYLDTESDEAYGIRSWVEEEWIF